MNGPPRLFKASAFFLETVYSRLISIGSASIVNSLADDCMRTIEGYDDAIGELPADCLSMSSMTIEVLSLSKSFSTSVLRRMGLCSFIFAAYALLNSSSRFLV